MVNLFESDRDVAPLIARNIWFPCSAAANDFHNFRGSGDFQGGQLLEVFGLTVSTLG
jgi:hypothetical protein